MVSASFVKVLLQFMFVSVSAKARIIGEFIYLIFFLSSFLIPLFLYRNISSSISFRASENFKCKGQDGR